MITRLSPDSRHQEGLYTSFAISRSMPDYAGSDWARGRKSRRVHGGVDRRTASSRWVRPYWLSDTPALPGSRWGNSIPRMVTGCGSASAPTAASAVRDTHFDHDRSRRANGRRVITRGAGRERPAGILAGDFNVPAEATPVLSSGKRAASRSGEPSAAPTPSALPRSRRERRTWNRSIDWILRAVPVTALSRDTSPTRATEASERHFPSSRAFGSRHPVRRRSLERREQRGQRGRGRLARVLRNHRAGELGRRS